MYKNIKPVQFNLLDGFMSNDELDKANKFMLILANKINENLTLEKIAFYQFLKKEIDYSYIYFLTKNKSKFFMNVFADYQIRNVWIKKDMETPLADLLHYVPEFIETINEVFTNGEDLPLPKIGKNNNVENEIKRKEVVEFFEHFESEIENKSNLSLENQDHVFFLLCMKYLKQAGDELPLEDENVNRFYELFRKGDMIIPSDLIPYELTHAGAKIVIKSSKDSLFWELVCFVFSNKKHFLTKKQNESLYSINQYINNKIENLNLV